MQESPPTPTISQTSHVPACLNCSTPTPDRFCPHCGQEARNETISLQHLLGEWLSDTLGYDSKLIHTLKPLVLHPGFLTNEFIRGRRAPYLSPFRLYVFLSVLFFLIFAWKETPEKFVKINPATPHQAAKAAHKDGKQAVTSDESAVFQGFAEGVESSNTINLKDLPKTVDEYNALQNDPKNRHKHPPALQFIARRVIVIQQMGIKEFGKRIFDNLPKMMFVLLPVFALILKIIYLRSKRFYIEHLIFALHCHAFVFLALIVMEFSRNSPLSGILATWIAAYLFIAMRMVYREGWFKTTLKFSILGCVYLIILTMMIIGTLLITFVTV